MCLFGGFSFDGLIEDIKNMIVDPFRQIWGEILKFVYLIWASLAQIIDCIQVIFNMLVGTVKVVWSRDSGMGSSVLDSVTGSKTGTNNIIIDVFMSDLVLGTLIKFVVLSIFLLIIFTFIAVVKTEFAQKDGNMTSNAKTGLVSKSIRALLYFLCVPILCIFGVIGSGYLLQTLDKATSAGSTSLISNKIFAICSHDSNRVRTDVDFYLKLSGYDEDVEVDEDYVVKNGKDLMPRFGEGEREEIANYVDTLFLSGSPLPDGKSFNTSGNNFGNFHHKNAGGMNKDDYFNTKNPSQVFYYYDLAKFEWVIAFFTVVYVATILINMVLGAATRLFELGFLFAVSPGIISMYPLDNGAAFGRWKSQFINRTINIFAPVVALNLYFILVGTLVQVDFKSTITLAFDTTLSNPANLSLIGGFTMMNSLSSVLGYAVQQLFNLFILIAGLQVVQSSTKFFEDILGFDDKKGQGLGASVEGVRKGLSAFSKTPVARAVSKGAGILRDKGLNIAEAGLSKAKGALEPVGAWAKDTASKGAAIAKGRGLTKMAKQTWRDQNVGTINAIKNHENSVKDAEKMLKSKSKESDDIMKNMTAHTDNATKTRIKDWQRDIEANRLSGMSVEDAVNAAGVSSSYKRDMIDYNNSRIRNGVSFYEDQVKNAKDRYARDHDRYEQMKKDVKASEKAVVKQSHNALINMRGEPEVMREYRKGTKELYNQTRNEEADSNYRRRQTSGAKVFKGGFRQAGSHAKSWVAANLGAGRARVKESDKYQSGKRWVGEKAKAVRDIANQDRSKKN